MAKQKIETKKVKFLLSPTGEFNLAYNIGDEASLPTALAIEVVEAKYAEFVNKKDNELLLSDSE